MKSSMGLGVVLLLLAGVSPAHAQNTFSEVGPGAGIAFERAPSLGYQTIIDWQDDSLVTPVPGGPPTLFPLPMMSRGFPGVAVFDYDGDGDLDILATNGPGADNALYQNQLAQTGTLTYVDMAAAAGIGTHAMDVNGVCYGDTDNDGDPDVLLLGRDAPNAFFVNEGDGTFRHVGGSDLDLDSLSSPSCTMGDVDGDGLLDIFVANAVNYDNGFVPIFAVPWAMNQANQLFLNDGDETFTDASARVADMDNIPAGAATITWAASMVDMDLDGDIDIVFSDDNGGIPITKIDPVNGVDRAFLHVLYNDGTGHFSPYSVYERAESPGSWMGLGFADLDHDGSMDMFASNFGDYGMPIIGLPYTLGDQETRPLFGRGDGSFSDPTRGESSSFGWGNAVFDIDNDGDSDAVYHGSLDMVFFAIADNPGVVLLNDGAGNFTTDVAAMGQRHSRRNVHGVARGDLDRDGFVDVITAANFVIPAYAPMIPGPAHYGDVLDGHQFFAPVMAPTPSDPSLMQWIGIRFDDGDLSIERNNGESGHGSITVRAVGSVGTLPNGHAPRDGTGAVFSFQPDGGATAMMPITAGSSHTSAHAHEAYFGLGSAGEGQLDVLWPGGNQNRLYGVQGGESVSFPEIPCSVDTAASLPDYARCVTSSLNALQSAGAIDGQAKARFLASALVAYHDRN